MRRVLMLAVVLLALGFVGSGSARADGDPASDVLLQQDVFLPYSVPTSQGTANALAELTTRLRKAGWPVKVAIIASGDDLGSAAQFATDPQGYADFLYSEIRGVGGQKTTRLLIVTPVGFGGENLGDNVNKALAGLSETKADGDALGKLALTALGRLAAADRHPVPVPAIDLSGANGRPYRSDVALHGGQSATLNRGGGPRRPGGGGGSSGAAIGVAVGLTLVLLAAGAVLLRQRRRVSGP